MPPRKSIAAGREATKLGKNPEAAKAEEPSKQQQTLRGWLRSQSAPELRMPAEEDSSPQDVDPTPVPSRSESNLAAAAVPTEMPSEDGLLADAASLRLKGTFRMEVRNRRPKPEEVSDAPEAQGSPLKRTKTLPSEAIVVSASDDEGVPAPVAATRPTSPSQPQLLRISAGRAAAAAGIHRWADIGEMFLELLYQDLPGLLLEDAKLAGVEVVAPAAERARLLGKSGEAEALESALKEAAAAPGIEGAQAARQAVSQVVAKAEELQRLSSQEAQELRQTLELEINLEFGARHEDNAIEVYEGRVGRKVYGQQHRVSVPMPAEGHLVALAQALPPPHPGVRPKDDLVQVDADRPPAPQSTGTGVNGSDREGPRPFFRLTGFVDGLLDVPRASPGPANPMTGQQQPWKAASDASVPASAEANETLVVEVKHRMGKIKEPPEVYDIVQLCCYCRALGCTRGDLVQCLRTRSISCDGSIQQREILHVTRVDFSEGSEDRKGWDQHVLPGLYATAAAVYKAREDQWLRLRILSAATPEERSQLVGELCPHL